MNKPKSQDSFQLKADFFPVTVMKLQHTDIAQIQTQLIHTIEQAPNYLRHAPVIIEADSQIDPDTLDITALCQTLREQKIIPIGLRGVDNEDQQAVARDAGLAILKQADQQATEQKSQAKAEEKQAETQARKTKLITKPIRSGAQVYAKDADLIVLASVSPGAECFADGNIHIYGTLRGRALAGANGDRDARIFCHSLDAELLAIAGYYLTKEELQAHTTDAPMLQIYLEQDTLRINGI